MNEAFVSSSWQLRLVSILEFSFMCGVLGDACCLMDRINKLSNAQHKKMCGMLFCMGFIVISK